MYSQHHTQPWLSLSLEDGVWEGFILAFCLVKHELIALYSKEQIMLKSLLMWCSPFFVWVLLDGCFEITSNFPTGRNTYLLYYLHSRKVVFLLLTFLLLLQQCSAVLTITVSNRELPVCMAEWSRPGNGSWNFTGHKPLSLTSLNLGWSTPEPCSFQLKKEISYSISAFKGIIQNLPAYYYIVYEQLGSHFIFLFFTYLFILGSHFNGIKNSWLHEFKMIHKVIVFNTN